MIRVERKINDNKQQIKINSIVLALFFTADMLTKLLTSIISINNNLVIIYIVVALVGLSANTFFKGFKFNLYFLFSFFIFFILLGISVLRVPISNYTIQYMVYFIVFYLLIGYNLQFKYSVKLIFRTINTVNILFGLYLILRVVPQYQARTLNIDYTMDLSYTALIGIFSFLIYYFLFKGTIRRNILKFSIDLIFVIYEIYFMLVISYNRGALFSLLIFLFIFLIRLFNNVKVRLVVTFIISIIGLYIYTNLLNILTAVNNYLMYSLDLKLNWLSKTTYLLTTQSFDTGRNSLYKDAWEYFLEAPIMGNGIGSFASTHGGQYPHNIFLESLHDQGIIISLILFVFIIYTLVFILLSKKTDFLLLIIYLFSLSIPRLLMSSTIWNSSFFWVMVILMIFNKVNKKDKVTSQNNLIS